MNRNAKISISYKYKSKHLLLISILVAFLIPVIVITVNIMISYRVVKNEVNKNNDLLLEALKKNTDAKIDVLETAMMNIELLNTTNHLTYVDNHRYSGLASFIYQMQLELDKVAIANPLIEEISIYFLKNDYIVTNKTSYTMGLLESNCLLNKSITSTGWFQIQQGAMYRPRLLLLEDTEKIVFFRVLKREKQTPLAYIAITIDKEDLLDELYNSRFHQDAIIVITTDTHPLLSTNNDITSRIDFSTLYDSSEEIVAFKDSQIDYTVIIKKSESYIGNYLYIVPTSIYAQKLKDIISILTMMLAIVILLGCFLIPQILHLNYKPIESIVKRLGGTSMYNHKKNEFLYIMEEIENKQTDLNNQNEDLQKALLSHALVAQLNQRELAKLKKMFDKESPDSYCCLLLHFGDGSSSVLSGDILKYAIENIMGELLSSKFKYQMAETDGYIAFILLINGEINNEVKNLLQDMCTTCIEVFREHFLIDLFISTGQSVMSADKLHISYNTAKDALDYSIFFQNTSFTVYGGTNNHTSIVYGTNETTQLANAIFSGDKDSAQKVFIQMMEDNMYLPNLSMSEIRNFLHDFFGSLMKINSRIRSTYKNYSKAELFNVEYLYGLKDYTSIKEAICIAISKIIDLVNSERRDAFSGICSEISAYIEEHYMDKNLNVNEISELFHFTPSYLSKNFKAYMGTSILDYINIQRINQAKVLLKQGYKISEISERTGFSNSNSLIRVFKKVEGVTPGNYKELLNDTNHL